VNRGLAILGDRLFMGTIDGKVIALNAKTGAVEWQKQIDRPEAGYSITVAPLVVKDKIILGPAGGEYGIRGYIMALDPKDGNELWRFWTIPEPGQPGSETWTGPAWQKGGGPIWTTGTYDPDLNLMYWGRRQPRTGLERRWPSGRQPLYPLGDRPRSRHWRVEDGITQFTPHDEFDYDAPRFRYWPTFSSTARPARS
jgi:alcohol dehydrogenase (cytochrome c)